MIRRLTYLSLDSNVLGKNGIAALARAFQQGAVSSLRELHLRNNDIQGRVGACCSHRRGLATRAHFLQPFHTL